VLVSVGLILKIVMEVWWMFRQLGGKFVSFLGVLGKMFWSWDGLQASENSGNIQPKASPRLLNNSAN
jgi:hypothetical protein